MTEYLVIAGGLMRCCLESLDQHMKKLSRQPRKEEILKCQWCPESIICIEGVWRFKGERFDG